MITSSKLTLLVCSVLVGFSSVADAQSYLFNRADIAAGTNPGGVAVGDFNRDGKLDLAITDSLAQTVSIFLGQSNGTFKKSASYPAGYEAGTVVTGDFNKVRQTRHCGRQLGRQHCLSLPGQR